MAATEAQVKRLRRMVAETTSETYDDTTLAEYIETYPLVDQNGEPPEVLEDGVFVTNTLWTATYDLNAAAAAIWNEKASSLFEHHDLSVDGGQYSMSQKFEHAKRMARHYGSRKSLRHIAVRPYPKVSSLDRLDSDLHN